MVIFLTYLSTKNFRTLITVENPFELILPNSEKMTVEAAVVVVVDQTEGVVAEECHEVAVATEEADSAAAIEGLGTLIFISLLLLRK
jgi:hypothetical protein